MRRWLWSSQTLAFLTHKCEAFCPGLRNWNHANESTTASSSTSSSLPSSSASSMPPITRWLHPTSQPSAPRAKTAPAPRSPPVDPRRLMRPMPFQSRVRMAQRSQVVLPKDTTRSGFLRITSIGQRRDGSRVVDHGPRAGASPNRMVTDFRRSKQLAAPRRSAEQEDLVQSAPDFSGIFQTAPIELHAFGKDQINLACRKVARG